MCAPNAGPTQLHDKSQISWLLGCFNLLLQLLAAIFLLYCLQSNEDGNSYTVDNIPSGTNSPKVLSEDLSGIKCNNKQLLQIMEQNIFDNLKITVTVLHELARDNFDGNFTVFCSKSNINYLVKSPLHCETTVNDVTCIVYQGSTDIKEATINGNVNDYSKQVRKSKPRFAIEIPQQKALNDVFSNKMELNSYYSKFLVRTELENTFGGQFDVICFESKENSWLRNNGADLGGFQNKLSCFYQLSIRFVRKGIKCFLKKFLTQVTFG